MTSQLEKTAFSNFLNDRFQVQITDTKSVDFTLVEVESLKIYGSSKKSVQVRNKPFFLIFVGPSQPIFKQKIYNLTHPQLGSMDIFLVPVGQTNDGIEYQAVFN